LPINLLLSMASTIATVQAGVVELIFIIRVSD